MTKAMEMFDLALMAEASYVSELNQGLTDSLKAAGMPEDLASYLVQNWLVVDQIQDEETSSSFSATLFRNRVSGRTVLAIKGTLEVVEDLIVADGSQIVGNGLAIEQIVDLYNYWQRLSSANQGDAVQQAFLVPATSDTPAERRLFIWNSTWTVELRDVAGVGLGKRNDAAALLAVTGHSLGGHLASAFTRLFSATGSDALTINGAGYPTGAIPGIALTALSNIPHLFAMLGGAASFDSGEIQNIYGDILPEVVTMDNVLGLVQPGGHEPIHLEKALGYTLGHGSSQMTDALAVTDLFVRIDSAMVNADATEALEKFDPFLKAATAKREWTYETVVNRLLKLFGSETQIAVEGDREKLYSAIQELRDIALYRQSAGALSIAFLGGDGMSTASIAELAKTDVAYAYSLVNLIPYVITGSPSLYIHHNKGGGLEFFDETAAPNGKLSERYLKDRAEMLSAVMSANVGDVSLLALAADKYFKDAPTELTLGLPVAIRRVFGGKDADSLDGGVLEDDIFGGDGVDIINGGGGADYIEGNDGGDDIRGGAGEDEIWGGEGIDTIDGDTDKDTIYGGKDGDRIKGDAGNDIIYADAKDETSTAIVGDDTVDGGAGEDEIHGGGGNDTLNGGADNDKLYGNANDDTIRGDGENDIIDGGTGEDKLYGDDGNDEIKGGDGVYKDLIVGGLGDDALLEGGDGDDTIYGDDESERGGSEGGVDRLYGGAGNDRLYGGAGSDYLEGGDNDDTLQGGEGLDLLNGGVGFDTYIYNTGDGANEIVSDIREGANQRGAIKFDGQILRGGKLDPKTGEWKGDGVYYVFLPSQPGLPRTLAIGREPGLTGKALLIPDFENNDLGIKLDSDPDDGTGQLPFDPVPLPPRPPEPPSSPRPEFRDPLVLDLSGTGIQTVGLDAGLHFDHDGDGFREATGWVAPGAGMLMLDTNGDGALTNGTELFGDFTPVNGNLLAVNGFQALSQYDRNGDGRIDASDPIFGQLRVWQHERDAQGNAIIVNPHLAGRFSRLSELGITAIELTSTIANQTDAAGNTLVRSGRFVRSDGTTATVAEYRLVRNEGDAVYSGVALSEDVAALPNLPGYGRLRDLRDAIQLDETGTLRAQMNAFGSATDASARYAAFQALLYEWAGATTVAANSLGAGVDAQHVAVLNRYYGKTFPAGWGERNDILERTYTDLTEGLYGSLLLQGPYAALYQATTFGQESNGARSVNLSGVIPLLQGQWNDDSLAARTVVAEYARALRGLGLGQSQGYLILRETFIGLDPSMSIEIDASGNSKPIITGAGQGLAPWMSIINGTRRDDVIVTDVGIGPGTISAYQGNDVVYGSADSDALNQEQGNAVIVGGAGNDTISAGDGTDIVDGGAGDDRIWWSAGDDVFIFRRGSGRDTISEWEGGNRVFFGSGITQADVVFTPNGSTMLVGIRGTDDRLVIEDQINSSSAPAIAQFEFMDGTRLSASEVMARLSTEYPNGTLTIQGTSGPDRLKGAAYDEVIVGFAGDDRIEPGLGNDIINAGPGNDIISSDYRNPTAVADSDTYLFARGDGQDIINESDPIGTAVDRIVFASDISPSDVTLSVVGLNLLLKIRDTTDQILVSGQFQSLASPYYEPKIERVEFADGTVWDAAYLRRAVLTGTTGKDEIVDFIQQDNTLVGLDGDDYLSGQGGDDIFIGGRGDDVIADTQYYDTSFPNLGDTFVFNRGDGHDAVAPSHAKESERDRVLFGDGIGRDDLQAYRNGYDLVVNVLPGSADSIRVLNWFRSSTAKIDVFEFADGTQLSAGDIESNLVHIGTDGADNIQGYIGNDTLVGNGGDDRLTGDAGNDTADGGAGDDDIWGQTGDDRLLGGVGNDDLYAEQGDDLLRGGEGHDRLYGGEGSDTYEFARGDGQDQIGGLFTAPDGGTDTLRFEPGIAPSDVRIRNEGGNLVIAIDATVDRIDVERWYSENSYELDRIAFADGTVWDAAAIKLRALDGSPGNDSLTGYETDDIILAGGGDDRVFANDGDDVLDGGSGDDELQGGDGSDTFHFGRGYGKDAIVESLNGTGTDTVRFNADTAPSDVLVRRVNDDLVLSILGTGDALTIVNGAVGAIGAIEAVQFSDGTVWDQSRLSELVVQGTAGADEIIGLDTAETIDGGGGNDVLMGGDGDDTYRFGRGYGRDVIDEQWSFDNGFDSVEFDASITPGDVQYAAEGADLVVYISGTQDELRIKGWIDNQAARVESFQFADGTVTAAGDIYNLLGIIPTNDRLFGTDNDDRLIGTGGETRIFGRGGDDLLVGNAGADLLYGGDGDDTLQGGTDDDNLSPEDGANTIVLNRGDGSDYLYAWASRTFMFRAQGADPGWEALAQEILNDLQTSTDTAYANAFWRDRLVPQDPDSGPFYPDVSIPLQLTTGLTALADGVPIAQAQQTLQALLTWLRDGDTVRFGEGITPADLSVQIASSSLYLNEDGGWYGTPPTIVVGYGGDDSLVVGVYATRIPPAYIIDAREPPLDPDAQVSNASVRRFEFSDGTVMTLDQILALADEGVPFGPAGDAADNVLIGSATYDYIYADGGNDIVKARNGRDNIDGGTGDDVIDAGSGDDFAIGGDGNDVIVGGAGFDYLDGGQGSDVYLFNRGDEFDFINQGFATNDIDTLSFGPSVSPTQVTALISSASLVLLVDSGWGGSVSMAWFADGQAQTPLANPAVRRVQFVGADGSVRVFDLQALAAARHSELVNAAGLDGYPLFETAAEFELVLSEPVGGMEAIAYALTGDTVSQGSGGSGNGTAAADTIIGTSSADSVTAADGDDIVVTGRGEDAVDGGTGNDYLDGGEGADTLVGGPGNDRIIAGAGDDSIHAGPGDDVAIGGQGTDTYYFNVGDGMLSIVDAGSNRLIFGTGITASALKLSIDGDFLVIGAGSGTDTVRISGFSAGPTSALRAIDTIVFDDGTTASLSEIIARGIDGVGTPLADLLVGAESDDRLSGFDGDDELAGGAGSDRLDGGSGNDIYRFNLGDGVDTIVDRADATGGNEVVFGTGIAAGDLALVVKDQTLTINVGSSGDAIRFEGFDPGTSGGGLPVSLLRFADGTSVGLQSLLLAGVSVKGTDADDVVVGTAANDVIDGLSGDDTLVGGLGNDRYVVGADGGNDTIVDTATPTAGNTLVLAGASADVRLSFDLAAGTLDIVAPSGQVTHLTGFDPADPLGTRAVNFVEFTGTGERLSYEELLARGFELLGTDEADSLRGTAIHDQVTAGAGNDVIETGTGDDSVAGGEGNDTYVYRRGDGVLTIDDIAAPGGGNVLQFGAGITAADLARSLRFIPPNAGAGAPGVLVIRLGDSGDEVRLTGFDPEDAEFGQHAVETFVFDDGTTMNYRELVRSTFVIQGDQFDNALQGTSVGDRLYGFEGFDALAGGHGDDVLTGGTGNDELAGGTGRDAYVFNLGDGIDTISDASEAVGNIVTFGAGIDREDVRFVQEGALLRVLYGDQGDEIRIAGFYAAGTDKPVIDAFEFADGSTLSLAAVANTAPTTGAALPSPVAREDEVLSFTLPVDSFTDPEGQPLTLSATRSDGRALPSWLSFDPVTRTFRGTPENIDVGVLELVITATDPYGLTVTQTMSLSIEGTNDVPQVTNPLVDQVATEEQPLLFTLPPTTFVDVDQGDAIVLSAQMGNGTALPSWLTFEPATRTFSGTPGNADVGTLTVAVTATDSAGATVTDTFDIIIANANDAPVVVTPIADQIVVQDALFSLTIPVGAISDPDAGDELFVYATRSDGSPLPDWLTFDSVNRTFTGTPGNADVGTISVKVTAIDSANTSVTDSFDIVVNNVNDAPLQVLALPTVAVQEDVSFTATVSQNTFIDVDVGDSLSYTATLVDGAALPSWVSFDPATLTFTGQPGNAEVGTLQVRLTATDQSGSSTSGTFALVVSNANDAPTVATPIADSVATEDQPFSLTLPAGVFADVDVGDTLTLTATRTDGTALPSWLSFDPVSRQFSGTPGNGEVGVYSIAVTGTDSAGASATDTFNITVENTNDAPSYLGTLPPLTTNEDAAFSVVVPSDAFTDIDVGDTLTYSARLSNGTALPAWLTFDPVTRTLSGTPDNGAVGQLELQITATDRSGATATGAFTLTVNNVNDAPILVAALPDQTAREGELFSFTVAANAFADVDVGDTLTLSATLADGSALPPWLAFDPVTRLLSGTPPSGASGVFDVQITARDAAGAAASDVLRLSVDASGRVIVGTNGNDTLVGTGGDDTIDGRLGTDSLQALGGNDTLQFSRDATWGLANVLNVGSPGSSGSGESAVSLLGKGRSFDTYDGGAGIDTLVGTSGSDVIALDGGTGTSAPLLGGIEVISTGDGDDVVDLTSTRFAFGSVSVDGGNGNDVLWTNAGNDTLLGGAGNDRLSGDGGNDILDGGAGSDELRGGSGDDIYYVDNALDQVFENSNQGEDLVWSSVSRTLATNFEHLFLSGVGAINGTGNALGNWLKGNAGANVLSGQGGNDTLWGDAGSDTLNGDAGIDLLQGGSGNDQLTDSSSNGLLDGGDGADVLTGGGGRELYIGGKGNDTINTSTGVDVVAFNRGDGADTINASTGSDNTLSLGGGIRYADMVLNRSGLDLILGVGGGDQITLKNWYQSGTNNRSVVNLQMIAEAMSDFDATSTDPLRNKKVTQFNFLSIVSQFDAARAANSTLQNWAISNALASVPVTGSDTAALGGDLAYQYGKNGTLAGIGAAPAQSILSNASFGTAAQTLQPIANLQTGTVRLS